MKKYGIGIIAIVSILTMTGCGNMFHLINHGKTKGISVSFEDYGEMVDFETKLDEFAKIDIDLSIGELSVIEGDGYSLTYRYPEKLQPQYEVKDGSLVVKPASEKSVSLSDDISKKVFLTVTVPVDTDIKNIKLDNAMGDITVRGVSSIKLDIDDSMGDIVVSEASFSTISIDDSMGDISISDIRAGEIKGSSSMGDSSIESSDIAKVDWNSSMGEIILKGKFEDLDIDDSMGDITIDSESPWSGKLETSMGDIVVNGTKKGDSYSQ